MGIESQGGKESMEPRGLLNHIEKPTKQSHTCLDHKYIIIVCQSLA